MTTADLTRADPPMTGGERAQLTGFLDFLRDFLRATVHVKAAGLSEEDAHRATLRSPLMTVAGLVSHLRWAERYWFADVLGGRRQALPYDAGNPDGDFLVARDRSLSDLLGEYAVECEHSREMAGRLDLDTEVPFRDRGLVSVRWVLLHMVEETGRHAGHLDVVRENLDGVTGE
jgi:uncharacterized damage-inducible protein DinB